MAAKTERYNGRYAETSRSAYVYGNTVMQPAYDPNRSDESSHSTPKRRTSAQVRRNRRQVRHMNRAYLIFLACAAIIALLVCVNYVRLQSSITSRSENISAMQSELAELKEANDTKYNSVMDSVNLDEIRTKAQEELGMVYASQDQIITYESPATDYVEQYDAIPENGVLAQTDN
jgi:cell division protein FtsL